MRNYIIKVILLSAILLSLECRTREDQERLGLEQKKKETFTEWQWSVIRCIIKENPPKELCTDAYWQNRHSTYTGFVELNSPKGKICGGLSHTDGGSMIFKEDDTQISDKSITGIIPLKCKNTLNSKWFEHGFFWYKLESETFKKANHIFTHSIVLNANGNPADVNTFSNYNLGDNLLCCWEFQQRDDCNRNYSFVICNKLAIL